MCTPGSMALLVSLCPLFRRPNLQAVCVGLDVSMRAFVVIFCKDGDFRGQAAVPLSRIFRKTAN